MEHFVMTHAGTFIYVRKSFATKVLKEILEIKFI